MRNTIFQLWIQAQENKDWKWQEGQEKKTSWGKQRPKQNGSLSFNFSPVYFEMYNERAPEQPKSLSLFCWYWRYL